MLDLSFPLDPLAELLLVKILILYNNRLLVYVKTDDPVNYLQEGKFNNITKKKSIRLTKEQFSIIYNIVKRFDETNKSKIQKNIIGDTGVIFRIDTVRNTIITTMIDENVTVVNFLNELSILYRLIKE